MLTRLRKRLADERGTTIVEMVLTCVLTLIVSGSAMAVLTSAYSHNNDVQRRTESLQIARTAVDQTISRLRNEVCLSTQTPITAANGESVTYYADFGDADPTTFPERHVLSLNPTTRVLSDVTYTTSTGAADAYSQASTRVIAKGVSETGTTPLLQFYGYDTSASPPTATRLLNTGTAAVADADLPNIARIVVTLTATAPGNTPARLAASAQDEAFVRLTDPSDDSPAPTCD
jgi:type II secretory pathway pseudopilin PulG